MRGALETIAKIVSAGEFDAISFPWAELRYQHTQAIYTQLSKNNLTFGSQLLQLDLAAFMFGNYGGRASRTSLADHPWTWNDIATYPTLL